MSRQLHQNGKQLAGGQPSMKHIRSNITTCVLQNSAKVREKEERAMKRAVAAEENFTNQPVVNKCKTNNLMLTSVAADKSINPKRCVRVNIHTAYILLHALRSNKTRVDSLCTHYVCKAFEFVEPATLNFSSFDHNSSLSFSFFFNLHFNKND